MCYMSGYIFNITGNPVSTCLLLCTLHSIPPSSSWNESLLFQNFVRNPDHRFLFPFVTVLQVQEESSPRCKAWTILGPECCRMGLHRDEMGLGVEEWQVSLPLPELRSLVRVAGVWVGVADAPSFKAMFSPCQKLLFYLEFQIFTYGECTYYLFFDIVPTDTFYSIL